MNEMQSKIFDIKVSQKVLLQRKNVKFSKLNKK